MSDNNAPIDPLLHDMEPELDEATDEAADDGERTQDHPAEDAPETSEA